jgi:hypothetical protein
MGPATEGRESRESDLPRQGRNAQKGGVNCESEIKNDGPNSWGIYWHLTQTTLIEASVALIGPLTSRTMQ